jgi:hypothetical protein
MEKIMVLATDESPQIQFDPKRGLLEITGKSLPEDINEFYTPLENAVKQYITKPQEVTTINFDLVYLNSSSTKKILSIITLFEDIYNKGHSVTLNWYYDQYDEDMMEEGEEFARLTEIPVKLIEKKE